MALDPTDPAALEQLRDGVARGLARDQVLPGARALRHPRRGARPVLRGGHRGGTDPALAHGRLAVCPIGKLELSNPLLRRRGRAAPPRACPDHRPPRPPLAARDDGRRPQEPPGLLRRLRIVRAPGRRPTALSSGPRSGPSSTGCLFGSDYPMWTPKAAVDGVREIAANRIEGMPAISNELHRPATARRPARAARPVTVDPQPSYRRRRSSSTSHRCEASIRRVAETFSSHGIGLRPHVKTSKCLEAVSRERAAGTLGVAHGSTPAEVEAFGSAGFTGLLWAHQPVGAAQGRLRGRRRAALGRHPHRGLAGRGPSAVGGGRAGGEPSST